MPDMTQKPGTDVAANQAAHRKRQKRNSEGNTTSAPSGPSAPPSAPYTNPPSVPVVQPYGDITKALLPYLSPEDSNALETFYGFTEPDRAIPNEITGTLRNYYLSKGRATSALTALDNMKIASKKSDLGPGYTFLTNAIGLLNQFGAQGEDGLTRQAYSQFSSAMDDLFQLANGNEDLAPYANLASMFIYPGFTAGPLVSQSKVGGRTVFGSPSSRLYT